MLTTETGKAKCVACGLCPDRLPGQLHQARAGRGRGGEPLPAVFEIDEFRCIFCGYCQEVCPEEAIHVGRHYENAEYSAGGLRLRPGAPDQPDAPGVRDVGPRRPEGGVMAPSYPLFYSLHFYLFGLLALASALLFVTRKSPVAAALWLVNVMFSLAALYVMLDAHFVGAMQVLVYAGAIMVVFLFVVMLLNLGHAEVDRVHERGVDAQCGEPGLRGLLPVARGGRSGVRDLRHDGGGGGGRRGPGHRDLPVPASPDRGPRPVGGPARMSPADLAGGIAPHALDGTAAEWIWLVVLLPLLGALANALIAGLDEWRPGPYDPDANHWGRPGRGTHGEHLSGVTEEMRALIEEARDTGMVAATDELLDQLVDGDDARGHGGRHADPHVQRRLHGPTTRVPALLRVPEPLRVLHAAAGAGRQLSR
jgi:ferredoxin